jgi:hypothetical protein
MQLQRINETRQCRSWVEARDQAATQQTNKSSALAALIKNAGLLTNDQDTAQTVLEVIPIAIFRIDPLPRANSIVL